MSLGMAVEPELGFFNSVLDKPMRADVRNLYAEGPGGLNAGPLSNGVAICM